MFTGPLYMLQVYDRVLASGSEATLVTLSLLVITLFAAMGMLDHARGKVMAVVGARVQEGLDHRVFAAALARSASAPRDPRAMTAQRDLEALRIFLGSPASIALMDLPWTPLFLAAIFVFHPVLGWLSVLGGAALVGMTLLTQVLSRHPQREAGVAALKAERAADQMKAEADTLRALGMASAGFDRWLVARREALRRGVVATGIVAGFAVLIRTFRLFLQSAMLGLGAWLALKGELSAGAMIAGSILMGRVLAPIDVAVGQWAVLQRAVESWHRLAGLLTVGAVPERRMVLPRPRAVLEVDDLTVGPPGEGLPLLQSVSFRLEPGQALGVIGPSGAGKSTLAKALTGVWPPLAGRVRLDGAALDQYDPDRLGRLIGYLPQRITLFDGTVADNIARLETRYDSALVVDAARRADAHGMILRLPLGYESWVSAAGGQLSGGQVQRVGLARALFGDPVLLVLDEPNSNLDGPGSAALNATIRWAKSEGKAILIMAHRPAAIQECDLLLVLEGGRCRAFGPRDQILREEIRNHTEILKPASQGAAN
jgi:ATP-binding cassette subfamily C protein